MYGFNYFDVLFNSFDFIFWIIMGGSALAIAIKGLFWFSLIKGIFAGLGFFSANSYGTVPAAAGRNASGRDWMSLGLTVVGLFIGLLGLLKS